MITAHLKRLVVPLSVLGALLVAPAGVLAADDARVEVISPADGATFTKPQTVPFKVGVPACCFDHDALLEVRIAAKPDVDENGLLLQRWVVSDLHSNNPGYQSSGDSARMTLEDPKPTEPGQPAFYAGEADFNDFGAGTAYPTDGSPPQSIPKPADDTYYWQATYSDAFAPYHGPIRKIIFHFTTPLPTMSPTTARKYAAEAVKDRRPRAKSISSTCQRLSSAGFKCKAKWKERGRRYSATEVVQYELQRGKLIWTDRMTGLRPG